MARQPKDSFGYFLEDVARQPMLDKQQEYSLSKEIQKAQYLVKTRDQTYPKGCTVEEWAVLVELTPEELNKQLRKSKKARDRFINGNLRLVIAIARKFTDRGVELVDMVQDGTIGLAKAVDRFNPDLGYKFSTYAIWWIRQMIRHKIRLTSRTIRLPTTVYEKLTKIKRSTRALSQDLARVPTLQEISFKAELKLEDVEKLIKWSKRCHSLDVYMNKESGAETIINNLQAKEEITSLQKEECQHLIYDLMIGLKKVEQDAVIHTYGLLDNEALRVGELAKKLNLTIPRVKTILEEAKVKLKDNGAERLFDYVYTAGVA